MDLSFRNSLKHMRDLWAGEEFIRQKPLCQEQGDCTLDKTFTDIANTEVHVPSTLESASFEFLQGDTTRRKNSLRSLNSDIENFHEKTLNTNTSPLRRQKLDQKMAPIVGIYQHERNENLDEYFKAVGVPYIPRKMIGMTSPRLEISNDGEKWTIRTISMMRTVELIFTLGEEYEESMAAGVTLKNVTTMEGDSLVTVSVGPDNNKVVRKYEVTEDGVVLTMTHENSGQVAKRYFKRLS